MNIVYVSEQDFVGEIPDDLVSYRSDLAWIKMLEAFHLPYNKAVPGEDNEYFSVIDTADVLLFVPSKNHEQLLDIILYWLSKNKTVGVVQEGPKTYWQNWSTSSQIKFLSILENGNLVLCHNEADKKYFESLTDSPVFVLRTVQDVDYWVSKRKPVEEKDEIVFVGGNMVEWYGGMHSYLVGSLSEIKKIVFPSMGRKRDDEETVMTSIDDRVSYIPYLDWENFMKELNKAKYAVHMMPVSAAGSFSMNCGSLGIPCIGNKHNDTQRHIFPDLSIEPDDIEEGKRLMKKLVEDQEFYDKVVSMALENVKEFSMKNNRDGALEFLGGVMNG